MLTLILAHVFLFGKSSAVDDSPKPSFNAITKNVTVISGDTAILPCSVINLGNFKIVWLSPRSKTLTLNDRRIIADDRISLERPYKKEWNLHIRQVKISDTGTYQCQINTSPVQVRPVKLIVQEPSKIIEHLSTDALVKVTEGDTVELVCNVTGLPIPTVTWYRVPAGLMENGDTDRKQIGMEGEVLVIHNVSRYCDDEYECVAYNGVSDADYRKIRVNVQFPPEVRLPNRKIGQILGLDTILECEVTAFPNLETVWRYKGTEITKKTRKYSTEVYNEGVNKITLSLKIRHLTREDYGDYECLSKNHLGSDSEIMRVYEYKRKTTTTTTTTTSTMLIHTRKNDYPTLPPTRERLGYEKTVDNNNIDSYIGKSERERVVDGTDARSNSGYKKPVRRPNLGHQSGTSRSGRHGNSSNSLRQNYTIIVTLFFLLNLLSSILQR